VTFSVTILKILFSKTAKPLKTKDFFANASFVWEAAVLPMNYSRRNVLYYSRPFFILQHEKWRVF